MKYSFLKRVLDELSLPRATLNQSHIYLSGLTTDSLSLLMSYYGNEKKYNLILTAGEDEAFRLYEGLSIYREDIYYFPTWEGYWYDVEVKDKEDKARRLRALSKILSGEDVTLITSIESCLFPILDPFSYQNKTISLAVGQEVGFENLHKRLEVLGYERSFMIESQGQYCLRGGIVDIFDFTQDKPIRIEFWGDEIDSIKPFDLQTQRSFENIDKIEIFPSKEYLGKGIQTKERKSLFDYFPKKNSHIFMLEPERLELRLENYEREYGLGDKKEHFSKDELWHQIEGYLVYGFSENELPFISSFWHLSHHILTRPSMHYGGHLESLKKDLEHYLEKEYRIVFMIGSMTRAKRFVEDLSAQGFKAIYHEQIEDLARGYIHIQKGFIKGGFEYPDLKFVLVSDTDIFGYHSHQKKVKKYKAGQRIDSFSDLKVGEYLIHEEYGIGIFKGLERLRVDKITKEYLKIGYSGADNLYMPITQLNLLTRYCQEDKSASIKLHSLSGQSWHRLKSKAKAEVVSIAEELVKLYAHRQSCQGFSFEEDNVWQKEFEESFPYEETKDQLVAINEVKEDMQASYPMDRLICGDVGFGKTEVAIRAAFKAVQDSKQVAFLAPTTILAQQHFRNFKERMADYPIKIGLLCRFETPKSIAKTLEELKKGQVDIVIGTHRLLSKDVVFKDLGLLIVDEEQRFGVKHKEKLKELKVDIDVLTLSATPIPRTLHMSLSGIRQMSLLEEAPRDRMPIKTYVLPYQEEAIIHGIRRELARGGQVYYIYNRVQRIYEVASKIRSLVPEARIGIGHGQMSERELEKVMIDFIQGRYDVLLATTIVESGLDIPNANTIFIQDADYFGLAQLYQLRGRVGRSHRLAYAYLLHSPHKNLSEEASRRLDAIGEYTALGSGYRIAMRDLEIRGAGALLGKTQSGHIDLIGYEMYCKLLEEALLVAKGEKSEEEIFETSMDLLVEGFIPDTYIEDEGLKLDMYKRISMISSKEDYEEILDECIDRFGEVPKMVLNLLRIALTKSIVHLCFIQEVVQKDQKLILVFSDHPKIVVDGIPEFVDLYQGKIHILTKMVKGKMKTTMEIKCPQNDVDFVLDYLTRICQDFYRLCIQGERNEVEKV